MDPQTALQIATGVAAAAGGTTVVNNILSKENMTKLLGPMFKAYGDDLGLRSEQNIQRRRENAARVVIKAQEKLGDRINEPGSVHPKVWKEVFDDGSYAEDELAADYFGGVLASSRTGVARDDRGAAFAKMVGRLSVYQLRSHFITYNLIKGQFNGYELSPSLPDGREKMTIFIPFPGFINAMELDDDEPYNAIFSHVLFGLNRESLIGDSSQYGTQKSLQEDWQDAPNAGVLFTPSALGVELFH
ncbi:MAG: hypothetical protein ACR2GI_05025, partial [Thermomicrobiales bacterium]